MLDVTVGDNGTEVAVVSGRVRVKSLDERRQIDLHAGYTGYASLQGEALAVRRGADQHLEAVPPIVVPALHPDRNASATAAPGASGTATPAAAAAPVMVSRPAVAVSHPEEEGSAPLTAAPAAPASTTPASAGPDVAAVPARSEAASEPASRAGEPRLAQAPLAQVGAEQTEAEHAEAEQAEQIRRRFDGLTEGLLDGLLPAPPPGPQSNGS